MRHRHGTATPSVPGASPSRYSGARGRARGRARDGCAGEGRRPGNPRTRRPRSPSVLPETHLQEGRTSSLQRQDRPPGSRRGRSLSRRGGRRSRGAPMPGRTTRCPAGFFLSGLQATLRSSGDSSVPCASLRPGRSRRTPPRPGRAGGWRPAAPRPGKSSSPRTPGRWRAGRSRGSAP